MTQSKKFMNPVYKADGTNRLIEVGDDVAFILDDGSVQSETLTAVSDDGRWVSWDHTDNTTRKEDVRAVDGVHQKSCEQYA